MVSVLTRSSMRKLYFFSYSWKTYHPNNKTTSINQDIDYKEYDIQLRERDIEHERLLLDRLKMRKASIFESKARYILRHTSLTPKMEEDQEWEEYIDSLYDEDCGHDEEATGCDCFRNP